jgi:hypothetical protein
MDLSAYLTLAVIVFTIGDAGIILNHKNIIIILMSVELILLACNERSAEARHGRTLPPHAQDDDPPHAQDDDRQGPRRPSKASRRPSSGRHSSTRRRRRNEGAETDHVEDGDEPAELFGHRLDFFAKPREKRGLNVIPRRPHGVERIVAHTRRLGGTSALASHVPTEPAKTS